jgi:predicted transposase/invertase (TIGR01784 family)
MKRPLNIHFHSNQENENHALREEVFEQLFTTAEIARFTPDQVRSYEKSLKYYRDMKNSLDTAFDEGKEEGKEEGRAEGKEEGEQKKEREIVINGLKQGLDLKMIAALTGLQREEIEKIKQEMLDKKHQDPTHTDNSD